MTEHGSRCSMILNSLTTRPKLSIATGARTGTIGVGTNGTAAAVAAVWNLRFVRKPFPAGAGQHGTIPYRFRIATSHSLGQYADGELVPPLRPEAGRWAHLLNLQDAPA